MFLMRSQYNACVYVHEKHLVVELYVWLHIECVCVCVCVC